MEDLGSQTYKRIAIITGGSSGIGRAAALRLAKRKIRMILTGRDSQKLKEVSDCVNKIAGSQGCVTICGDISSKNVIDQCISASWDTWKEMPGIFIASAGRGLPGTVINSDIEQWDSLIDTNIKGLLYQMKGIAENMLIQLQEERDFVKNPLDIIVIGSSIGRNVSPFNSVYGATKFAAHGLTEALRRQLGPKGIRVTLIEPGLVGTNFQLAAGYDLKWFDEYSREVGPILVADDVANVIEYLIGLPGNVHLDNISIRPTRQAYP
jgi:NADP-dependent 3-hydroxy acid dehydrogenase YdfG